MNRPTPTEVIASKLSGILLLDPADVVPAILSRLEAEGYIIVNAADIRRVGAYLRLTTRDTEIASLVDELYALTHYVGVTTAVKSPETPRNGRPNSATVESGPIPPWGPPQRGTHESAFPDGRSPCYLETPERDHAAWAAGQMLSPYYDDARRWSEGLA